MDSEMSDGTPVSPELDAQMLADLRAFRARHDTGLRHLTLTIDELDMLLRVAAERDALKRDACEMPDERQAQWAGLPVIRFSDGSKRDTANCRGVTPWRADIPAEIRARADTLPAGHAIIGGVVVPLPTEQSLLPFCNCGSVDKYGDDLGEHGPHCPYHLAVIGHVAAKTPPAVLDDLCRRTLKAQERLS